MILSVKTDQSHHPRTPFQGVLGNVIAYLRDGEGLSQRELAELAGVDRGNLCEIEIGTANPKIATLEKIAAALRKDITQLLKIALDKMG